MSAPSWSCWLWPTAPSGASSGPAWPLDCLLPKAHPGRRVALPQPPGSARPKPLTACQGENAAGDALMIPIDFSGKVALVTGVGDHESFAWFISKALQAAGARLVLAVHPRMLN